MVVTFDRNSGTFSKEVTDELNKAFATINEKIQNYSADDLAYKETVSAIDNSGSFRVGNLLCIRTSATVSSRLDTFTKIGEINVNIPFDVWHLATTSNSEAILIHIKNHTIYATGKLTSYPQTVYINADVVIPNT